MHDLAPPPMRTMQVRESAPLNAHLRIATDPAGHLPRLDPDEYDLCLTTRASPPPPWVRVDDVRHTAAELERAAAAHGCAAAVLLGLLRATGKASFADALVAESVGYSTLLGGRDFRDWAARQTRVVRHCTIAEPVRIERSAEIVTVFLADPRRLNAYSSAMRDALAYALDSCLVDPTRPAVLLRGDGRAFCSGGALDEFGTATDLAEAHRVRMEQSAARRIDALGVRMTAVVHGAAIGSGIEIAAAAARVLARPGTWFRLPELAMGLIPGAGGTVTVTRRIGRHRAAYLMLSGARLEAADALAWGLVDGIVAP